MGGKNSKTGKESKLPDKSVKLTSKDIDFLTKQTGMSKDQVQKIFQQFSANNPDGKLDRAEFEKLYTAFRNEPVGNIDEIDDFVFRAFDKDNNGFLTFNEFMTAVALTSRGDPRTKLDYAFELYDADNNGYLTLQEIRPAVSAMFDLLGAHKTMSNVEQVANECADTLDKSNDDKISKDEFINGLLQNYNLRVLMSPFN